MSKIEFVKASDDSMSLGEILKDAMTDKFETASIRFIQDVKRYKGGDAASETIRRLTEVFGQEWSNGIIYNIVAGDVKDEANIIRVTTYDTEHFINRIKELRAVTWMGLKESKDAIEWLHREVETWMGRDSMYRPANPPYLELHVSENAADKNHIPNLIRVGFRVL